MSRDFKIPPECFLKKSYQCHLLLFLINASFLPKELSFSFGKWRIRVDQCICSDSASMSWKMYRVRFVLFLWPRDSLRALGVGVVIFFDDWLSGVCARSLGTVSK